MIDWLQDKGFGEQTITYKLRDWLFSRQRYWGEPFPIVYDEDGAAIGLPESMLPLELPDVPDYSPKTFDPDDAQSTPEPPLSRATEWVDVELDLGDGPKRYRRETNTMPNWAGSCWYELRYLDPANQERVRRPGGRALLDGPAHRDRGQRPGRRGRPRRCRPLRRWRRARRPAPAVLPLLAQGAVRPRARLERGAVPAGCSTRATSRPTRSATTAASRCRRPRCTRPVTPRTATSPGPGTTSRSRASTARWASR